MNRNLHYYTGNVAQTVSLLYRRLIICEYTQVFSSLPTASRRHGRLPICATLFLNCAK